MIYLQITVSYYVWIYNVTLAFIGAFVVVNLILAVVAIKFVQIQGEVFFLFSSMKWEIKRKNRKFGTFSAAKSSISSTNDSFFTIRSYPPAEYFS